MGQLRLVEIEIAVMVVVCSDVADWQRVPVILGVVKLESEYRVRDGS